MNEAGANELYEAERKGVRQIKGAYSDSDGGRCALGVLGVEKAGIWAAIVKYDLTQMDTACPACGLEWICEDDLIAHLNDDHGLTFAQIARKLGPDHA